MVFFLGSVDPSMEFESREKVERGERIWVLSWGSDFRDSKLLKTHLKPIYIRDLNYPKSPHLIGPFWEVKLSLKWSERIKEVVAHRVGNFKYFFENPGWGTRPREGPT